MWAILATIIGTAGPAAAHPLGNFTTNRYARIEVSAGTVRVYYVLDEAELRAFESRDVLKRDHPCRASPPDQRFTGRAGACAAAP
jgi:nickel/cobalt exporter